MALQFFPTQLDGSEDLCVEFAIDTFVESFGSTEKFFKDNSAKGEDYLRYLQQQIEKDFHNLASSK